MITDLQSADLQCSPVAGKAQLAALLHAAGVSLLDDLGWLRVTGEDRLRWLNGLVTNSIQELSSGQGCYNFVLNAQGRIQGDLTAFLLEDSILLQTRRDEVEKLLAHLNHYIIMDDVELVDMRDERAGIGLIGPKATDLLRQIGLATTSLASMQLQTATWRGSTVVLLHAYSPLVPRYELWADSATIHSLTAALIAAGGTAVSPEAMEQLRILEGTPCYGIDIRNTETAHDLPQETGQTRALHFSKGCYLGQEIVERIHSRGKVHRALSGFLLTGALPAAGTQLEAEGKPVAELTSVSSIPLVDGAIPVQLALGIIRREVLERKLPISYAGGMATPIDLPYEVP